MVSGATTALSRRTTLRKGFLGGWHPLVSQCWLYALADAQRHTDVAVHHSVLVVSHHHTSVTPARDNLPDFCQRLHRDMSCAVHVLLCKEKYDAPRELFDDRSVHMMRLLDAAAQASHLVYEYLNPPAAGLVERPEDMPGRTLDFGIWKTGYIEVERPPVFFDASRPERLRLYLTPPPLLYRAFGGDMDRLVHHMRRLGEDGLRAIRAARTRPVMGAEALRRLHPWSEPRTMRESGGGRVPSFKIGARGIVPREQRIAAAMEVCDFRREHEAQRIARRDGDFEARFPFGTYAMRAYRGAPVEPAPPPGALVALPGPLLEQVRDELAREGRGASADAAPLVDEVRAALRDEAADIVEDAELDRPEPRTGRLSSIDTSAQTERDTVEGALVVVRHRFDTQAAQPARRLITLRDRRRGRPPPPGGTHGSDPPA